MAGGINFVIVTKDLSRQRIPKLVKEVKMNYTMITHTRSLTMSHQILSWIDFVVYN